MEDLKVAVLEESRKETIVDEAIGNIGLALEKLEFLTSVFDDNYIDMSFSIECPVERIQRELFVLNAMMQDYLEDIREAKDELEDVFDL